MFKGQQRRPENIELAAFRGNKPNPPAAVDPNPPIKTEQGSKESGFRGKKNDVIIERRTL